MRIVNDYPPNIEKLREAFNPGPNTIFTYGEIIYNPSGGVLSTELLAHEKVHITQQGAGAEEWWQRYLDDVHFRLAQEIEAHRVEYKTYCAGNKDRNRRSMFLQTIARRLSSPMYGNIITFREALRQISQ